MSDQVKYRGVNELRQMFLDFFESKGHLKMKSFSLVPHNDNSLLLINSGMAPLKPYFTGQEIPPRRRVTTCQKCIRTGDIENVGKTARHGTFFEMLGNFSFGDYFKTEAIHWSWEFLTEVVGLEADRLYPSVYQDDDEAFEIWNKEIGVPAERIYRFGKEDNFWEHGAGPCGPCSEIYYDRGEKYGTGPEDVMGGEGDRFMEIWNNVFTQFENDGNNNYTELSQKNIDTGMGLERLAVVVQDVDSIFDVDTLQALRDHVCKMSGIGYKDDEKTDISIRVITDHIRSVTFMVSDGIMPSNEGRGYVLRRLLRRAARHGRLLGIQNKFLADLATTVIEGSKDRYPELEAKKDFILEVITREEDNFYNTIDQGLSILEAMEKELEKTGSKELSGSDAFKLYDTYGFPIDLTMEILEDKGMTVDEEGFKREMSAQREKARAARKTSNYMGAEETVFDTIDPAITTEFVGYESLEAESVIRVMTKAELVDESEEIYEDTEIASALSEGEHGTIITDKTPFYGTMGGQDGDTGVIETPEGEFTVTTTIHLKGGKVGHIGFISKGMIRSGDKVVLKVDSANRSDTCKNHSATHLLHAALKTVLGSHVEQSGSLVKSDRLRFDFTHFQPMTAEEIEKVEALVNGEIQKDVPVITEVMTIEEARKTGATALFGEKYGDNVRVVSAGDFSKEFCGGTHVKNTGSIQQFKIISEAGISAGVRRIEALTGSALKSYYAGIEADLKEASRLAKTEPHNIVGRIAAMLEEIKALRSENESMKSKLASQALSDSDETVTEVKNMKILCTRVDNIDANALRDLGDKLKEKVGTGIVVIAGSAEGGKVNLIVMATDNAVKNGGHAGNLIKQLAPMVGGGGGGRPNMAQAGGKEPSNIDKMLAEAPSVLETLLP
ncbi:MAG: alanine--tRNA ligase [Clostridiales bacterium]|nr:alanine--tRNA ligase [Clostridiales bacterium]